MIFVRLEVHYEDGYSSTPYTFCTKCRQMFYMGNHGLFCSACGHKLDKINKEPLIFSINKKDNPDFNEHNLEDVCRYLRSHIDWDKF